MYVPRIEDKESHMCMLHITNIDEDLVANSMNILEPTPLMPLGNPRANSKVSFHFAFNLIPLGLISCCCISQMHSSSEEVGCSSVLSFTILVQ